MENSFLERKNKSEDAMVKILIMESGMVLDHAHVWLGIESKYNISKIETNFSNSQNILQLSNILVKKNTFLETILANQASSKVK